MRLPNLLAMAITVSRLILTTIPHALGQDDLKGLQRQVTELREQLNDLRRELGKTRGLSPSFFDADDFLVLARYQGIQLKVGSSRRLRDAFDLRSIETKPKS